MSAIVEASVIIRCINRASAEFNKVGADAKTLEDRLKGMSRGIAGIGALTIAAGRLAGAFGLINPQAERVIAAIGALEIAIGILTKTQIISTIATWAHSASWTVLLSVITVGVGTVIAMAVAMKALAEQASMASRSMREVSVSTEALSHYGVRHEGYATMRRGLEY